MGLFALHLRQSCLAALACSAIAPPAAADLALATARNCMSCHAMDRKVVGPAFKDVAAKYKDDQGAADRLATKILKGGSGVWGPVPMPANTQVSEADAKKLAAWVLSTR
ncbi:MAG: c-type cytochrome [Xenophilus sp.]